ncbi:MAG TPA: helix-turn-helix transcriptional regulator [Syntrophorhabdaceae bacterium]|nr:helix-turn-helix transcriptional regulator [Syntrophorhabdaceae bacterium]
MQKNTQLIIANRFRELYRNLSENQKSFALKIGYSQGTISRVENGQIALTRKMKQAISRVFPQVNTGWLETGKGEMFVSVPAATEEQSITPSSACDLAPQDDQAAYEALAQILASDDEIVKTLARKSLGGFLSLIQARGDPSKAKGEKKKFRAGGHGK